MRRLLVCLPVLAVIAIAACSPRSDRPELSEAEQSASAAASASASRAADVAAGYVGRWTGPEAASLEIVAREHDYQVSITGAEVSGVFTGTVVGDAIQVDRSGQKQLIRHATGPQTGVRFLADKQDCIIVAPGEGYCRD